MAEEKQSETPDAEENPPFGSWRHWYLAVVLNLVVLIILSYIFTRAFD